MIIGKSGTTRKRIESETRSKINVPKQGASSDPNSKIPISIRKDSLLAGNPNQKSMKIPDMFFQIPNSNQYFHYFFDDFSSSIWHCKARLKNAGTQISMFFTSNEYSAPMEIKRIKILGAVLTLPARQHCQLTPFTSKMSQMG